MAAAPWNNAMENLLIEEVKKRESLWDVRHEHYKTRTLRKFLFEEISDVIKKVWPQYSSALTSDGVMKKFRILKGSYLREKRKFKNLKSGSGSTGFCSNWIHSSSMGFLDEVLEAAESICTLGSTSFVQEENCEEIEISVDINKIDDQSFLSESAVIDEINDSQNSPEPIISHVPNEVEKESVEPPRKKKKKNIQNKMSDTLDEARKLMKSLNDCEEDVDDAFSNYIKIRLREIRDPTLKEKARLEIQDVLYKYEMECINK